MAEAIPHSSPFRSLLFCLCCVLASQVAVAQAELSPALQGKLATMSPGETVRVHVLLKFQADAHKVRAQASAKGLTREQRADRVVDYLKSEHEATQAPLVNALADLDGVDRIQARWIVNLVGFDATPEAIAVIAQRSDVLAINLELPWIYEQVETQVTITSPNGAELGLKAIKAPAMWKRGYTGLGGVSLTSDTGVDPYHPALNYKYAGHDGRPEAWFVNGVSKQPDDCGDHGTHVTGTIVGLDRVTKDTIGVAPNAHWIGGAVLCGFGASDNLKLFEWALDPDRDATSTTDRPFVINNSWFDPSIRDFECTERNPYPRVLDNLQTAGVAVVWSAGNDGPKPSTITPPHSYNANITNAFTVGALDGNRASLPIAEFSSRGPATCVQGTDALDIKPEVSAPGVNVRSALPGGGYGTKSGTSMASPHTAGAVLLLHEAFPELDGDAILKALYFSARDLGEPGEDNTFGRGIIDVDAAFEYLVAEGNTAVAPRLPDMNVNVVASGGVLRQCAGPLSLSVDIANGSTSAIKAIKYELKGVSDEARVLRVDLSIPADSTGRLTLRPENTSTGSRFVSFRILEVNGMPTDRRLDLGASWNLRLTDNEPPALVVSQPDSTLCLGSPVELTLTSSIGDRSVTFFSPDKDNTFVPPGAQPKFIIPSLDQDLRLFGINEYRRGGGPAYPGDAGDLVFEEGKGSSVRFRALRDGIIRKLTINQLTSGRVGLDLKLAENKQIIGQYNTPLQAGVNELQTYFIVEAGVEYVLEVVRAPKLAYRTDVAVVNTSVVDFVEFREIESETPALKSSSFFFFDWEIGYEDGCAAIPVVLKPDSTRTASTRELVVDDKTPTVGTRFTARDAKFPYGSSYVWTLGDRVVGDGTESVDIVPARVGTFPLRMTTVDAARCAAGAETTVTVTERSSPTAETEVTEAITLWPNPTTESFALRGELGDVERVELYDVAGRSVKAFSALRSLYPVSDLPVGVYVVQLRTSQGESITIPLEINR